MPNACVQAARVAGGDLGAASRPAVAASIKRLTMRSSNEWNANSRRGTYRAAAAELTFSASTRARSDRRQRQSFTRMRSAWKL